MVKVHERFFAVDSAQMGVQMGANHTLADVFY